MYKVDDATLETLFTKARSQNGWLPGAVSDAELQAAYDLARWGPTSMNTQPMRLMFLRSDAAKSRLRPALSPTNVDKVMTAPVVALVAFDQRFFEHLPKTFPHNPNASSYFSSNEQLAQATAFRNGSLQAAYLIIALRAVGLDVGPMSGFDHALVDREFFSHSSFRINLICGIGHGDPAKVFGRSPRFELQDVAVWL